MIELEISVEELVAELTKYSEEVKKELKSGQYKVAHRIKKLVMAAAPVDKGKYKKAWRVTPRGNNLIVNAGNEASLTHLLEKGHKTILGRRLKSGKYVNKAGKRTMTRAQPHIGLAEEMLGSLVQAELERIFK